MATTLLARKSGQQDNAIATDDEHHTQLVSDPTVSAFSGGSTTNAFGGSSSFGSASTGGFSGDTFSTSTPTTQSSGFGGTTTGGFGGVSTGIGATNMQQQNLTQAGSNAAQGADVLVAHDKESSDWVNKKWRPMMGWMYMATCTADFIIFPVLWSMLQALSKGQVTSQWHPLTLEGAGLYHIAMGAVLGIAAYGRTKEKVEGKA